MVATVSGTFIVAVAAGLIPAPEQSFHAPHWVVGCAGAAFVLAGASFLAPLLIAGFIPADQYTPTQQKSVNAVQQGAGCMLLTCFAAVLLWIGFGPGERTFSSSIGIMGLASHGLGNQTTGRVLFGTAGVLIGVWAAVAWIALVRGVMASFSKEPEA